MPDVWHLNKFGVYWFAPFSSVWRLTRTCLSTNNLDKEMPVWWVRLAFVSILHWRGYVGKTSHEGGLDTGDCTESPERWGGVRAEWMLEGEILLQNFIESCLLPLSNLCLGQLESKLVRKERFREPRLESDRDCFPLLLEYGLFCFRTIHFSGLGGTGGGGCTLAEIPVDRLKLPCLVSCHRLWVSPLQLVLIRGCAMVCAWLCAPRGNTGNFGAPGIRKPPASVFGFLSEKTVTSDLQFKARNCYKYKIVLLFLLVGRVI